MYQVEGKDVIFAWLEREPNADCRYNFLEWLAALASEPLGRNAQRVPGILGPVYVEFVPVNPSTGAVRPAQIVVVRFLIAEQFHTVRILAIGPLP